MTFGSLFAGIGGMDLGFERAGMTCAWQVEIDPWARRILAKHWPGVRRWDDVRTFPPPDGEWRVDLIAGGFPCQDISCASWTKTGLDGSRSGLWWEFHRIIGHLRPRFVLVENVSDLLFRGIGDLLGSLSLIGYDAEWSVVPACAMGAPHTRARVFILAYPESGGGNTRMGHVRPEGLQVQERYRRTSKENWKLSVANALRSPARVPDRVDRLRGLGNSVCPQVAEWIGRRIIETQLKGPTY